MCRRSRRGRRRCVFTFWEKGGGEEFSGQTLVGGGSWVGNLRVFLFFRPPPFFPSLLLSRFAGFLPLFFLFVFSDFHFLLSPIRDGRWKGEGGDSGGLSFVFSSVPSSQKKLSLPLPLLHSIRLFFRSFFFSDGGGGGPPPPLSPPRPVPRLRHIFHLCQKEGEGGGLGHLTASSPSSSFFDGGGGSPSLLATLLLHPDP